MNTFLPILTSAAGATLTGAQWADVGIKAGVFQLSLLLMKPGYEYLSRLPSLATHVGWVGDIYIEAQLPYKNKQFMVCSQYDGRKQYYSIETIVRLLIQLHPKGVIVPQGIEEEVYQILWDGLKDTLLLSRSDHWTVSDKPAEEAMQGLVYNTEGAFSITDPGMRLQFESLDTGCQCPTCKSGFTRAYLHHLFLHTPLLCQRLLVQHNISFTSA